MALWAGRFSKEIDKQVNDFNSSISFDNRMFEQDIRGSIAHATMLAQQGILPPADRDAIVAGLTGILADLKEGSLLFDPDAEDIHMFVEAELTARIGDAGKRLHTARSRNDQVALDMELYFHDEIGSLLGTCGQLIEALLEKAREHLDTAGLPVVFMPRGCAVGDMSLMARCRGFILSNSTYSWWAQYLAEPGRQVWAPDRWYAHTKQTALYQPDWHRIPTH